jgi:ribosomal protein S17E
MGKVLTEQKVLERLNIDDFRHLTKDKIITMASMLDEMDPEVAKKALEQFPQFSKEVKEMLNGYKDTLDKNLESNRESVQSYYDSCKTIINSLEKQLDTHNISFEERKYIIEKMVEISDKMGEKDSQNKKFLAAIAGAGATAVCAVVGIFASVLGGNTKIDIKDFNKFK